jgi:hypothetical protein
MQEGRLGAEVPSAHLAVTHTHRDPKQHRRVEIQISGGAGHIPHPSGCRVTAIARECRLYPAHMADLTGSLDHAGRRGHGMGHDEETLPYRSMTAGTYLEVLLGRLFAVAPGIE